MAAVERKDQWQGGEDCRRLADISLGGQQMHLEVIQTPLCTNYNYRYPTLTNTQVPHCTPLQASEELESYNRHLAAQGTLNPQQQSLLKL